MTAPPPLLLERLWTEPTGWVEPTKWAEPKGEGEEPTGWAGAYVVGGACGVGGAKKGACPVTAPPPFRAAVD